MNDQKYLQVHPGGKLLCKKSNQDHLAPETKSGYRYPVVTMKI